MPHRSIIRIPKNKNISKAGNTCFVLIIYFIILIVFRKYWIIINLTVWGLLITGAVVFYCLKASKELDFIDETSSSESDEEEIIYQAEIVSELPTPNFVSQEEVIPSAPIEQVIDKI